MLEREDAMGTAYEIVAREAHGWLTGPAAAIWLDAGVDWVNGGYFDQLSFDDACNAADFKRLRVTCRQIFVFATLDRLGVAGARAAMEHGLHFLFDVLAHKDGGFRSKVGLLGEPLDDTRDLYDLAFVLFALAAAFERLGDMALVDAARKLLGFLQDQMAHPPGGFVEAIPYRLPRRQNPHMHLLEACLAWLPHSGSDVFREQAGAVLNLAADHFWRAEESCLLEYFDVDWSPIKDPSRQIFEPGHHMEWSWLLGEARAFELSVPDIDTALVARARKDGFSPETGLPFGEVRSDGVVVDESCRLWTVTEWLRVCLVRPQLGAGDWQEPLRHLKTFLDVPVKGLWRDRCNARTYAFDEMTVPASSLYHIVSGLLPLVSRYYSAPFAAQEAVSGGN